MGRLTDILQRLTGTDHETTPAPPPLPARRASDGSPKPPPLPARRASRPGRVEELADSPCELALARTIQERVHDGRLIMPVLPAGMVEALATLDDSEATVESVERILRVNAELSREIVRTANSVWFGGRRAVNDLRTAVLRLGWRNLRHVLLGVALKMSLSPVGRTGALAQRIWAHSVDCSTIAGQIAMAFGADRDRLFPAGLLHDLGKVSVLATAAEELGKDPRITPDRRFLDDILARHHEPAGAQTARRWRLSEEIVACAAHHHTPADAGIYRRATAIVGLANAICHELEGPGVDSATKLAHSEAAGLLEVDAETVRELLDESRRSLARSRR